MIPLSTRTKESIKTALAMVIVYAIALSMGWDKPYWAGFAVAFISLDTAGASLNKAAMRMLGTFLGGAAALAFMSFFPQERWLMMVALALYAGVGVYMFTGPRYQYFWFVATFVAVLIVIDSAPPNSLSAFQLTVVRVQQTGMGILVYSLISAFLWPRSTRGDLEKASRELSASQRDLYHAYRELMAGRGTDEETQPLRSREVGLLSEVGQHLAAAESDSYAVRELRNQWRQFYRLSEEVMERLERWRETFAQLREVELTTLLPNIDAVCAELDLRFAETASVLAGDVPKRSPAPLTVQVDRAVARSLPPFQKAAAAVAKAQLDHLESLTRSLSDVVRDIRGHGREGPEPPMTKAKRRAQIDPDRLGTAVNAMVTLFIAFLVWVYVNPPMHGMFVFMATQWALVAALSGASVVMLVPGFILGLALGGTLYLFVMPHLSGFAELGLMLFVVTFVVFYLCWAPRRRGLRSVLLALVNVLISVDNEQSYSFAGYANSCAGILLSMALTIIVSYIPWSPRPEKVFMRLFRRFMRQLEFVVSRLALDRDQRRGWVERWKLALYGGDLLALPTKLARLSRRLDYALLPEDTPAKVQALTTSLQAVAYRVDELMYARELPHAEPLVREFHDELRDWRLTVQEQLRLLADEPDKALAAGGVDLEERLAARMARLDARIRDAYEQPVAAELSAQDYENFYRYLGGLRSMSEAGIEFIRLAQTFNWPRWREAKF
jgi:uncharacterized membrane protein YccC